MFTDEQKNEIGDLKYTLRQNIVANHVFPLSMIVSLYKNIFIAGGFFASTLRGEKFKDIDVFILQNDNLLFNTLVTSNEADAEIRKDDRINYMGNRHIKAIANCGKVQYILTDYHTREELINHFDFKHCCVSYDTSSGQLYISPLVYDCIMNKKLIVNNEDSIKSWRVQKFLNKDWVFDDVESTVPSAKEDLLRQHREMVQRQQEQMYQNTVSDTLKDMVDTLIAAKKSIPTGTYTISKEDLESSLNGLTGSAATFFTDDLAFQEGILKKK
jgi:hypothetical protein